MKSKKRILAGILTASMMTTYNFIAIVSEADYYSASISSVPKNVVSAYVEYNDSEWNTATTSATVSISDGTAKVNKLSATGYYTVTFCSADAETGSASFFVGDSGKIYSYEYNYDSADNNYRPEYKEVSTVPYVAGEYCKLLDISGNKSAEIRDVPAEIVTVQLYVSQDESHYGEMQSKVTPDSYGNLTLKNLGTAGDYTADFYDAGGNDIGYVNFRLGEDGKTYIADSVYNSATKEWEDTYIETDALYFIEYGGDEIGYFEEETTFSATVSGIPDSVKRVEVQYLNEDMVSSENYTDVQIKNKSVEMSNMWAGYYTVNFYDVNDEITGYSIFYVDNTGIFYNYDKSGKISKPVYKSFETQSEYITGNMSVRIYDVPEEIDSVEARYIYGDDEDEAVWFEPEISSSYVSPMTVSGFGTAGKYKLSFYENGEISGYADFCLDDAGKTYYIDSQYNSGTKQWEDVLVETDTVYYYVNTDINSADDYSYGSTKVNIINVPSDVKYAEVVDYETDSTFTAGLPIFPDVSISKGNVTINNFGESGYYEIDLIKSDAVTRAGYLFIYIDDSMNVYLLEYNINPDTFQIETTKTKTNTISMTPYLSSTVDYVTGKYSVPVNNVPLTANRILVTCMTSDGHYSTFEDKLYVDEKGTAKINGLGTEGDYTVSFMNDKNYLGTASFYLRNDGSVSKAVYKYNADGSISTSFSTLSGVVFEAGETDISYKNGDLDFSGSIDVSDIVLMQKYLLASETINSSQYYIADMTGDGVVDVFDIVCLRKELLK